MSETSGALAQTLERQKNASDPEQSSFVAANAGSGKTHVLTMRVLRLLLRGVAPDKILCLTFTKVAAANMATRIFKTLSDWTQKSDAELTDIIIRLGEVRPDAARLTRARRLFAEAVETPGGLKIQTIHAFCERVLHLFPFEANVPASFRVVQDSEQDELIDEAQKFALRGDDAEIAAALAALAAQVSEVEFGKVMKEGLKWRNRLESLTRGDVSHAAYDAALALKLGLPAHVAPVPLTQAVLAHGLAPQRLPQLAEALGGELAKALLNAADAFSGSDLEAQCEAYLAIFVTATDSKPKTTRGWLTKAAKAQWPALCDEMEAEQARIVELLEQDRASTIWQRSAALLRLLVATLQHYDRLKLQRSVLDFDDLIERTRRLLDGPGRSWVLFKLDQGIDHVLVDEAQDTSPAQWDIFAALVEEFFSGEGRSKVKRTVFAVGDQKQSIYSFQGAQPALFDANRQRIAATTQAAQHRFASVNLTLSFRSSELVLRSVDKVFDSAANVKGLTFGEDYTAHASMHRHLPGLIEIWPRFTKDKSEADQSWKLPVDHLDEMAPSVILARRIAAMIAGWLSPDSSERVADRSGQARRITAGDVLILVRKRGAFADGLNRELKLAGVPVAGADRLGLTSHIAILDLMAAGRAALLPLDDLQVACVLKSPLFEFDDDDLLRLAPNREGRLIDALRDSSLDKDRAAAARLLDWSRQARRLTPFQFYMHILAQEGGRKALLARLGQEAADVLDEFLSAALSHEAAKGPSLVTFLGELESSQSEIKRDFDSAGQAVRVMTVHASKGLEAKIVILADTASVPDGKQDAKLFSLGEMAGQELPILAWSSSRKGDCAALSAARARQSDLAWDEHRRLFYVAMTRAEERLYLCDPTAASAKEPEDSKRCWYDMAREALQGSMHDLPAPWDSAERIWRVQSAGPTGEAAARAPEVAIALPDWLGARLKPERSTPEALRPSRIFVAASAGGGAEHAALAGSYLHRLLQLLPDLPAERQAGAALHLWRREASVLSEAQRDSLLVQARNIMALPELSLLFSPQSRAEVALCGTLATPQGDVPIMGRIDRLVVLPERVLLVDFKTGQANSAASQQLALYVLMLQQIYPDKRIEAALVWTRNAQVQWLSETEIAQARDRAGQIWRESSASS